MNSRDELRALVERHVDKTGGLKASVVKLSEALSEVPGRSLQEKCFLFMTHRDTIPTTTAGRPLRFLSFRQGYVHLPLPTDMERFIRDKLLVDGKFDARVWRNLPRECADWLTIRTGRTEVAEGLYWLVHGLTQHPKACKGCGAPITRFTSFNEGYAADFCSLSEDKTFFDRIFSPGKF